MTIVSPSAMRRPSSSVITPPMQPRIRSNRAYSPAPRQGPDKRLWRSETPSYAGVHQFSADGKCVSWILATGKRTKCHLSCERTNKGTLVSLSVLYYW